METFVLVIVEEGHIQDVEHAVSAMRGKDETVIKMDIARGQGKIVIGLHGSALDTPQVADVLGVAPQTPQVRPLFEPFLEIAQNQFFRMMFGNASEQSFRDLGYRFVSLDTAIFRQGRAF
jgi:hypothetical protein